MSMTEAQRQALDNNLVTFCTELDTNEVLLYLQQKGILRENHVERIKAHPVKIDARQELLKLLKQRGSAAFNAFYDSLIHTQQHHLANLLKPQLTKPLLDDESFKIRVRPITPDQENDPPPPYESIKLPSMDAITHNEQFYGEKLKMLGGGFLSKVPQTEGILLVSIQECVDALPRVDETTVYPNFSKPKGLAIIFNNRNFRRDSMLPERLGTDVDARNMSQLLEGVGYSVKVKKDLSASDMISAMARFSLKAEHRKCDSTVVVILSHGELGEVYGSDGTLIQLDSFMGMLNAKGCPALINKPKIFFIQACRGKVYDAGSNFDGADGAMAGGDASDAFVQAEIVKNMVYQDFADAAGLANRIPADADMFIAYATTPGYVSWRNSMHGSWFVQALCTIIARHSHEEHISDMLTRVNNLVANKLSSTGHVQIPDHSNRLRRKFFFFPGVTR